MRLPVYFSTGRSARAHSANEPSGWRHTGLRQRCPARAAAPVQMISHRFPALEYIAEKMRTAIPGVEVNTQLMPFDKALELATIAFSSKASQRRRRGRYERHWVTSSSITGTTLGRSILFASCASSRNSRSISGSVAS